jgi:hypothetical protein
MKKNDQIAIFESYRDDILNKFKSDEIGHGDEPISKNDEHSLDDDIEGLDLDDSDLDDDIENEPAPKKNVVVKSHEISVKLNHVLRAILRNLPDISEDTEILGNIKSAIESANSSLDEDDMITMSPLSVYEKLIEMGVLREEKMDSDDFDDEKETDLLQSMDDDEYSDDDDLPRLGKSSDFAKGMRRDVERSKIEDEIRRMGTDWRHRDDDFRSSNY